MLNPPEKKRGKFLSIGKKFLSIGKSSTGESLNLTRAGGFHENEHGAGDMAETVNACRKKMKVKIQ